MKKYIFFGSLVVLSVFSCNKDSENKKTENEALDVIVRSPVQLDGSIDSTNLAFMTFDNMTWDFGTITAGEVITNTFNFTNTGKVDLVINKVESSCGCTVPEYEEEAVAPGESSTITVKFDSAEKSGEQNKTVTIFANTYPNKTNIKLKGYVKSN